MPQDFSSQNLRGRSFKGRNLVGTDFSSEQHCYFCQSITSKKNPFYKTDVMRRFVLKSRVISLLTFTLSLPITATAGRAEAVSTYTIDRATNTSSQTTHRVKNIPPPSKVEAQINRIPRTLKEAGFSNQPIFPSSNPISQTLSPTNPVTPEAPPASPLEVSPRIGASFTTGPGVGYNSSFGGFEGFVPLSQSPGRNLTFLQGQALLFTENAQPEGNVVVGYRTYSRKSNRILGGYVAYDIRNTGSSTFNQLGAGVESLGDLFDVRANGYIPVGNTRHQTAESAFNSTSFSSQAPSFQGNFLTLGTLTQLQQINRRYEAAMSGFDAEGGVRITRLGATGDLRGYAGIYYYDAIGTASTVGVSGRIEARPTDNFRVGLSVQSDEKFGTNVVLRVAANLPGTRPRGTRRQDEVVARLGDDVSRQENVVVDRQFKSQVNSSTSPVVATNPATNQPYLFQHVNLGVNGGNGTFENPFGIVQPALNATRSDGNDIVYVQQGTNPGIPAFKIPDRVQVLSTGPVQQLNTVERGNVQLPLSGAGVLPTVLPSGTNNVPGVTLGNNTVLSGFAINQATDVGIGNEGSAGTGSNPISNVTIRDNQITSSGSTGIRLTNVTGAIAILNNTITSSGVRAPAGGIRIANTSGQANVAIAGNNQISNNNGSGIALLIDNNAQVSPTISGNNISGNVSDGIDFELNSISGSNAQINNANIAENTISGNGTGSGRNGIAIGSFKNANADRVTISGNQISNNGAGIFFFPRDSSQVNATISGNTISGNSVPVGLVNGSVVPAGIGIVSFSGENATLRLLIDSNLNISNNQSTGIFLQATAGSNLFATVRNNTLTNNHTNPLAASSGGGNGNVVVQALNNSKVCLNLANNTSINPNPAGSDFNFFTEPGLTSQFSFSASGNTPANINFLFFGSSNPPPPSSFTTPLGSCVVP